MPRRNRAWNRAAAAAGTRWGGHPPAGRREHRVRFWQAIARGASSEKAAVEAGVLPSIGVRCFRKGGGMPPLDLAPVSGACIRRSPSARRSRSCSRVVVGGAGDRPSARSRTLDDLPGAAAQRCAAERARAEYRASTAQTHADRRARRPKPAKLAAQPGVAAPCGRTGTPRGSAAARRERRGPVRRLAWAASRAAQGPALGTVLESGADLLSATC